MSDDNNYSPFDPDLFGDLGNKPTIFTVFVILMLSCIIAMIMIDVNNQSSKDKVKQEEIIQKIIIEDDLDVKDANYNVPPVIKEIKVK